MLFFIDNSPIVLLLFTYNEWHYSAIKGEQMELLKVSEVAEMLKLTNQQVYNLKAQKKIPFIEIGGSIRFDKADIISWLNEHKKQ